MKLDSGHEAEVITGDENEKLKNCFTTAKAGMVKLNPGGWVYFSNYLKYASKIYSFQFRATDVIVMTYPHSGTTWMKESAWTMLHNADLNNVAADVVLSVRCPCIEADNMVFNPCIPLAIQTGNLVYQHYIKTHHTERKDKDYYIHAAESASDPRIIQTHLPFSLWPKELLDTCKIIYVARNPKDVCISSYHFCRLYKTIEYLGSFDTFVQQFVNDAVLPGPYWNHIVEAWNRRKHPNLHFVMYEDLKEKPKEEYQRLNIFLGTNLTEKQLARVIYYTGFASMKSRTMVNESLSYINEDVFRQEGGIFRKGEAGGYKTMLTKEQEDKFTKWIKKNTEGTDLPFQRDI